TPGSCWCRPPGSRCARSRLATLPPRVVGDGDAAVSPSTARVARNSPVAARTPGHPAIFAHVIAYYERGHAAFPGRPAAGQGEERDPPRCPSRGVPPHAGRPQGAGDGWGGHVRRDSSTGLIRPTSLPS